MTCLSNISRIMIFVAAPLVVLLVLGFEPAVGSRSDFDLKGDAGQFGRVVGHMDGIAVSTDSVDVVITGTILLQGVATGTAAYVEIAPSVTLQSLDTFLSTSSAVNADGRFALSGVGQLERVKLTASAPGFISVETSTFVAGRPSFDVLVIELRGGLVTADTSVSIIDVSALISHFGERVLERNDSEGRVIDLNADGVVSILDLSIVGSNFGSFGPSPWPLSVTETEKIEVRAADGSEGDGFGRSVSISSDTMVVGAPFHDGAGASAGAAYVFERNFGGPNAWNEWTKLDLPGLEAGDLFGYAVAIASDVIAVSAIGDDAQGNNAGAVHMFRRDAGGPGAWGRFKTIYALDSGQDAEFGISIDLVDGRLAVGACSPCRQTFENSSPLPNGSGASSGDVYLFETDTGGTGNWGRVKKLSSGETNDTFGFAVSLDDDRLVVGAPHHDVYDGAAYLYERNRGGTSAWGRVKLLETTESTLFGTSVAIRGGTVAVSAPWTGTSVGRAHIFGIDEGGLGSWGEEFLLRPVVQGVDSFGISIAFNGQEVIVGNQPIGRQPAWAFSRNHGGPGNWGVTREYIQSDSNGTGIDRFGQSITVDSNTVAIGAPMHAHGSVRTGAVYVYCLPGSSDGIPETVTEDDRVSAASSPGSLFGYSIDIDDRSDVAPFRQAIVGSPDDDFAAEASGSASFLEKRTGPWVEIQKVWHPDNSVGALFGSAVAIDRDLAVVGAPGDSGQAENSGAVFVYEFVPGGAPNWVHTKTIANPDAVDGDLFGTAVDVRGDLVIVGVPGDDATGPESGSVYVFKRDLGGTDNWGQLKRLVPGTGSGGEAFGHSVSTDGVSIAVGAPWDSALGAQSGVVNLYGIDQGGSSNWGFVKKILSPSATSGDLFGSSVSIHASTLAVGSPGDDLWGTEAGAAHLFEVDHGGSGNWGLINSLNASDPTAGDRFGAAVSLSFDDAVIGAPGADVSGSDSGAVYVFRRDETLGTWRQLLKLIASSGSSGSEFGTAVSISFDSIAVGAPSSDPVGTAYFLSLK